MIIEDERTRNEEAGFSLVEVLVTLALVSVLATTITMAISQLQPLLRADRQLETRLALQQAVRHVANLLEVTLYMESRTVGRVTPRRMFVGLPAEVQFTAHARRGAYVSGVRDVAIRLEDQTRLVQTLAPRRLGTSVASVKESFELADGVKDLAFSYYGVEGKGLLPAWRRTWVGPGLPLAIEVRLSVLKNGFDLTASDVARIGPR